MSVFLFPFKRYNIDMLELLFPLSITLAIEVPIYLLLKWRDLKLFVTASVSNLVLNLLMNSILYFAIGPHNSELYYGFLVFFEIFTTVIESLIIFFVMKCKYKEAVLHAFVANLTSLLVGLALNNLYDFYTLRIVLTLFFLSVFVFIEIITIIHYVKTHKKENAIE